MLCNRKTIHRNADDILKSSGPLILKYEECSVVSWRGTRNVHAFDRRAPIWRKKEVPLPNCICNSDDITPMFISRYIFDIDRMKRIFPNSEQVLYITHICDSFFSDSLDTCGSITRRHNVVLKLESTKNI